MKYQYFIICLFHYATHIVSQNPNLELFNIRIFNNSTLDTFSIKFDFLVFKGAKVINTRSSLENAKLIFDSDTILLDKNNTIGDFNGFRSGSNKEFKYILLPSEKYTKTGNVKVQFSAFLDSWNLEEKIPIFNWKGYSSGAILGVVWLSKGISQYKKAFDNYHNIYLKYTDDHDAPPYNYERDLSNARETYYKENVNKYRKRADQNIVIGSILISALPIVHFINKWSLKKQNRSLSFLVTPSGNFYLGSYFTLSTKYNF